MGHARPALRFDLSLRQGFGIIVAAFRWVVPIPTIIMKHFFLKFFVVFFLSFFSINSEAQNDVKESLDLAREYYQNEEYEKALSYLEKLQKKHKIKLVYELSLKSYMSLEKYDDAEDLILDFLKRYKNNSEYSADLIFVYKEQGKDIKAENAVAEILEAIDQNPSLAYGFANAFQQRGYPKIALKIYERAELQQRGQNFDYQKALLYGELGDIEKMYSAYVEMIERQPSFLNTVKQLLGRDFQNGYSPEDIEKLKKLLIKKIQNGGPETLNELLIYIYIKEKNFRGAFTQLKALDKRMNGNKSDLFQLGMTALNNDEFLTARQIFEYVIKAGSDFPFYESAKLYHLKAGKQRLLAQSSPSQEDWQALATDYEEVRDELKGQPEVGEITIELADIQAFQLDNPNIAGTLLKDLISTGFVSKEDQARAKVKLGDVLLYQGNRWDAIIYYGQAEKAFERSPIGQEAKFKRAKAAYYVGDFDWAQGIFDVLKASTSKLIANDALYYSLLITDNVALDTNTDAMTAFAKADLMNYQNKSDSALRLLEIMDIAFPDHGIQDEVLFLKAKIYIKRQDFQSAADALNVLLENHNEDILADDALYLLAQLYENELNRTAEAQELYQKIFIDHPDSFFVSEARKRYRELRGDVLN